MFSGSFQDIDQMSDTPTRRGSHHRRAQSESFLHFPDDILLDPDLDLLENSTNPNSQHSPMLVDSSAAKSDSSSSGGATMAATEKAKPSSNPPALAHLRSLSVGADFFDGVLFGGFNSNNCNLEEKEELSSDGRPGHHRRRYSMDGTSSFDAEESSDAVKKAMPPEKLAELALIDPKRAKRILANRQSAARSKERKIRYTSELERKVQTLQTEATTLSTQVTMLQRDTSELTAENRELKLRLQAMEQQAHLREALNETLRDEVQRLKIVTGHIPQGNSSTFNGGMHPRFSPQSSQQQYGGNKTQQNHTPQIARSSANNRNPNQPLRPSFLDFN